MVANKAFERWLKGEMFPEVRTAKKAKNFEMDWLQSSRPAGSWGVLVWSLDPSWAYDPCQGGS